MAITFSATSEPNNVPPRVRLDLATNDPTEVFDSIEIRRDGVLIRTVPPLSSAVSVLYDYDATFGTSVTYSVEGVSSGLNTLRNETWPNLSGWSTVSGTPAVSGGRLTAGVVQRTLAGAFPARGRLTVEVNDGVPFFHTGAIQAGPIILNSAVVPPALDTVARISIVDTGGTVLQAFDTPYHLGGMVVVAWGDGVVRVTTPDGSSTVSAALPVFGTTPLKCASNLSGFLLEEIISPTDFGPLTDTVTHDVVEAWLMHPVNPDLSVQLSDEGRRDVLYVEDASAANVAYAAQREVFSPLGKQRQVPVTYGRRRLGEWSLVVRTPRPEDRAAMLSILSDQSPLLLRTPPGFPWDLVDDWYSVGDVSDERLLSSPTRNLRSMTLPLLPVDEPVLAQGAQWTFGDDLARNPTFTDSLAEFPTFTDRLVGP